MSRNPAPEASGEASKRFETYKRQMRRNRLAQFFSDALAHQPGAETAMAVAQQALEVWEQTNPDEYTDEAILYGLEPPPAASEPADKTE